MFPRWQTGHAHTRRARCFGLGVSTSWLPATATTRSSSRLKPTPTHRHHHPGAGGARAGARGKHARSGAERLASAPPCGMRLACRSPAPWRRTSPLHHPRLQQRCLPRRARLSRRPFPSGCTPPLRLLTLLSAPICIPQAHGSCSFSLRIFPQGLSIHGTKDTRNNLLT